MDLQDVYTAMMQAKYLNHKPYGLSSDTMFNAFMKRFVKEDEGDK